MATEILQHPVLFSPNSRGCAGCDPDTFSFDELLMVLETENPFLMDMDRLETLINGTSSSGYAAHLRGYLVGIFDARKMFSALRPDLGH